MDSNIFLEKALKSGKIKEIEEAFLKYPVEEEYHKGSETLIFCEDKSKYYVYNIGDIVFVNKYYYSNNSKGKNHLFVIIEKNNISVPIEYFGMILSSNLEKIKYSENEYNNLDKDSILKTDSLYKLKSDNILFKIGQVEEVKIEEYKKMFFN